MKVIYTIIFIVVLIFASIAWYEYEYPCDYGHYEDQWITTYDGNGNISGGYYANVFVCDCRTKRK